MRSVLPSWSSSTRLTPRCRYRTGSAISGRDHVAAGWRATREAGARQLHIDVQRVEPEPNPGELRGRGVSGGEERQIGKGDILRIPNGVPHWVAKIEGKEIVLMVVKVSSAK
jgi:hypothetical protein